MRILNCSRYHARPCFRVFIILAIFLCSNIGHTREIINPKTIIRGRGFPPLSTATVNVSYTAHNRGNIQLAIANNGTFGTLGGSIADPFTGENIPSCIYPKNSDLVYLWVAAIWVGAVVGRDTLVSVGNEDFYTTRELWPDVPPFDEFEYGSIDINSQRYSPDAFSEEDIYCEYTDTLKDPNIVLADPFDNSQHIPLGIKVEQRSMAWSYSYADDFILFDYRVENIGNKVLKDVYLGIYADGDVWHVTRNNPDGWNDDIVGFYPTHPAPEGCGFIDTINIAYHADNDGDPENGVWNEKSTRGAVGVRVVRTPAEELNISYNWWIINYSNATLDFGPRQLHSEEDPYRNFGARMGTPEGDKNKYYIMKHKEFDYDLIYSALDHTRQGWRPPPDNANDIAHGFDCRYLLSFGPFDISPGQKLPISFAWVGGENLHQQPGDFENLFDPQNPDVYYNSLDFSNLASNSRWASWVYDNPGVDTDDDGYFGKFRVCIIESTLIDSSGLGDYLPTLADTFWYEGDGVPDFKGAGPPPAPKLRIIPENGKLIVRWNGYHSENTPDIFLRAIDFEGYRIYIGRDNRPNSFSLLSSYDKEDYNRFRLKQVTSTNVEWVLEEIPFTLDSLRQLFGDPEFEPLAYSRTRPYSFDGEQYFFEPQDFNFSSLSANGIHKVYPLMPKPSTNENEWRENELVYDYDRPLPKYYEYEFVIDNLLSSIPYYVAVTSFDFGSPVTDLPPLESSPTNNMIVEYPQLSASEVVAENLDAYVYPNPYRLDVNYRELGYEGRQQPDRTNDRVRSLHFANLPNECTIRIYSLDGDLIKEIDHNKPAGSPQSSHNEWDLITRNTQSAVSGLYYFVIESAERTQIGKFALIR